jgi:hypothetical protein
LFSNVQSGIVNYSDTRYWSGLEYAQFPDFAWYFNTRYGLQKGGYKSEFYYAVAVRDGNVPVTSPIPEPETYALMLAGLAVVGAAAKLRKAK